MKSLRSENLILVGILLFSISVDILWHSYVGFVRDDAFITFRFSQNIAAGHGFVYNIGERVYGTSSPGFTLLMAAWLTISNNPVVGALLFDTIASVLSLVLVWKLLETLALQTQQRALVLLILIWTDKLLLHSLEGMENPLVMACMLASLYFMLKEQPFQAGTAAGLMLWFRLDSGVWLVVMALVCSRQLQWRQNTITFLLVTALVYLPWVIFAQFYFGSIIPLTAVAKNVSYGNTIGMLPWSNRFMVLYGWLTPFSILGSSYLVKVTALITIIVAMFGAWVYRKSVFVQVLTLFFLLESVVLIVLNMTVEQRYMIYSLYALLVLFGLGAYVLIGSQRWTMAFAVIYLVMAICFAFPRIDHLRAHQHYVNDTTLTSLGRILKNSPSHSVVFLEPLGYVGYYSGQTMLDEVGLLTPDVVTLKRASLNAFEMINELHPDYVIFHCDDAERAPADFGYEMLIRIDPLKFKGGERLQKDLALQRNACYQIDKRTVGVGDARFSSMCSLVETKG